MWWRERGGLRMILRSLACAILDRDRECRREIFMSQSVSSVLGVLTLGHSGSQSNWYRNFELRRKVQTRDTYLRAGNTEVLEVKGKISVKLGKERLWLWMAEIEDDDWFFLRTDNPCGYKGRAFSKPLWDSCPHCWLGRCPWCQNSRRSLQRPTREASFHAQTF